MRTYRRTKCTNTSSRGKQTWAIIRCTILCPVPMLTVAMPSCSLSIISSLATTILFISSNSQRHTISSSTRLVHWCLLIHTSFRLWLANSRTKCAVYNVRFTETTSACFGSKKRSSPVCKRLNRIGAIKITVSNGADRAMNQRMTATCLIRKRSNSHNQALKKAV